MSEYRIRPVTELDIPFLWDMLYESLYTPPGEEPFPREIIQEPFLVKYVADWGRTGDVGFIAQNEKGERIGSITCRLFAEPNKGFGYVDEQTPELGMAIATAYRGQGIGTALMSALFAEAKQQGVKALSLSVDPHNQVVRMYKRFGFKEVEVVGTSVTMVAVIE
ncbi:GNAT family N-acetyltransferase [Paenibacillus sp. 481]|uniref:GNAT family N-acetyltransferase n=1 Tax=Paenibacillus sp. 481 TaxID=2835869 RepID=UPI001E4136FF|nr:GNAT family N-acetyltransferase [Paenibacillus sp. 481]